MFSNADWTDAIYMTVGTFGGILSGLSLPAFNVLFGEMLEALSSSSRTFLQLVADLCISFVIIAAINLFSGFLQVWSLLYDSYCILCI